MIQDVDSFSEPGFVRTPVDRFFHTQAESSKDEMFHCHPILEQIRDWSLPVSSWRAAFKVKDVTFTISLSEPTWADSETLANCFLNFLLPVVSS
ncbi:hypothetical protein Mal48_14100 [Thalassoglobus polymorphus]|uniref:Uncharacterized protein n=1 Tax=Thalassoglobus polymorphus TaxID=2527994 RepID=A0A517QKJ7_9PLAN|nr:hypothetical protein Mal48_14100 [Thalassoglobus polymorphus]